MPAVLKKIVLYAFLITHSVVLFAQLEAAHWAFGFNGGMDFTCSNTRPTVSPFSGLEGGATISSPTGELLFMTDGDVVWNKHYQIMSNGQDVGGFCSNYGSVASATQSAIIIPHPGNTNLYYIFTTDCAEDRFAEGVLYSVVDMSLNQGLGEVVLKRQPLVAPTAEKLAAVFQPDGKDVWLVTHGLGDNKFYTYSITTTGLNTTPVISAVGQVHEGGRGYLKFSPNGERLLANSFVFGYQPDGVSPELFKFNRNTGEISEDFIFTASVKGMYSASFSPNSKVLYLACGWACQGSIEQYNLEAGSAADIINTRKIIPASPYGAMQLGIDGKLYFVVTDIGLNYWMAALVTPNGLGDQAGLILHYVPFSCSTPAGYGLPNFIESYFETPVTVPDNCGPLPTNPLLSTSFAIDAVCNSLTVNFKNTSEFIAIEPGRGVMPGNENSPKFSWEFGDGVFINSQDLTVPHTYAAPGTYDVSFFALSGHCGYTLVQKEITIDATLPDFSHTADCSSLRIDFRNETPSSCTAVAYEWDFGDTGHDNTSSVPNPSHIYTRAGDYTVTLRATNNGVVTTRQHVVSVVDPLPVLTSEATVCFASPLMLGPEHELPGTTFLWNTGSTARQLAVMDPGDYSVVMQRANCFRESKIKVRSLGCKLCDTVLKNLSLGNDTTLCQGDTFVAGVPHNTLGTFVWSTGATTPTIEIGDAGTYSLTVTQGNCVSSAAREVAMRTCDTCTDFIANIITLNDDDKNDAFVFHSDCDIAQFSLHIYNRWGKTVHTSSTPSWNGTSGNEPMTPGLYFYSIHYVHAGSQKQLIAEQRKGWIQVVK